MSARDEILSRIRSAVAVADRKTPAVPRGYRELPAPDDLPGLFVERVADYRAEVVRCAPGEVESRIAAALGDRSVIVPTDLPWDVPGAIRDDGRGAADLDRIDAVVTAAAVGIAVTGTIVLDHGHGQGRRALSLVPDLHVCVVHVDQVVAGVPEAMSALDPVNAQTWISGPSATSDIELNRVEGVHGPRQLHVIVVERD